MIGEGVRMRTLPVELFLGQVDRSTFASSSRGSLLCGAIGFTLLALVRRPCHGWEEVRKLAVEKDYSSIGLISQS